MNHQIYVFYILQKINRTHIRNEFQKILPLSNDPTLYYTNLFLDCLVIVAAENYEPREPKNLLQYFENNFDAIVLDWENIVTKFTRKFSTMERRPSFSRDRVRTILKTLTDHDGGATFLKGLLLYISLAETADKPFDEPRLIAPQGVLTSGKRRTFFEPLVPLNTKWRK